jgi:hypothetical protein
MSTNSDRDSASELFTACDMQSQGPEGYRMFAPEELADRDARIAKEARVAALREVATHLDGARFKQPHDSEDYWLDGVVDSVKYIEALIEKEETQ